jgi:large subunit ribosomal protein L7/L12
MSQTTERILEKLKTLTLLEATELVSQIEKTFGVDASGSRGRVVIAPRIRDKEATEEEKNTFDVVLESIDRDKRVATLKAVRTLTSLGLKEAKEFCSSLPKVVKKGVTKEEAETTKEELEKAGSKVTIKLSKRNM